MKKSIIPILLCVIMLFCACKPTVEYTVSPNAVKYKYHTFKGTDWGMTKEECMKALGVDENDLMPLSDIYLDSDYTGFSIKKNVYGNPATVYFLFMPKWGGISDLGLTGVEIEYDSGCDNQAIYDNLCKELNLKKPGKYEMGVDVRNLNEKYESESNFKELEDKELVKKAKETFDKIQNNGKHESVFMYIPFSSVYLRSKPNEGARISFNGFSAAILHKLL